MQLKIDLHTHCMECARFAGPGEDVVRQIISAARAKGLNGIAVTDHVNPDYGFRIKEIAKRIDGNFTVIPGQEINRGLHHIVELYFPDDMVFRFIAHPGYPSSRWADSIPDDVGGIEINNGNWNVDRESVRKMAEQRGLLMLSNSDAHYMENIGLFHNDLDLEDLCSRCQKIAAI